MWYLKPRKTESVKQLAGQMQIHPILARLLVNRGITTVKDADAYFRGTIPLDHPDAFADLPKACKILMDLPEGAKLTVMGDYDADGLMASYILCQGFQRLLHAEVGLLIPDREKDGYGMNSGMIDQAYRSGSRLIVTCDNGSSAVEAVDHAKALGMTVIVTDHHEMSADIRCDAHLNARMIDKPYCGATVAYLLILGLKQALEATGRHTKKVADLETYAGIATITDVMELTPENRSLVLRSMKWIRQGINAGLEELVKVCGIQELTPEDVNYRIGPCLNACSRMGNTKLAWELLCARTGEQAYHLAHQVMELNDQRKELTARAMQEAIRLYQPDDQVAVLLLQQCRPALCGIVAGRISSQFQKPCLAAVMVNGKIHGSARAVEGYSLYDHLAGQQQYLSKFGGHPLAAGFSCENAEAYQALHDALNAEPFVLPEARVRIDDVLPLSEVTLGFAKALNRLQPFGSGNDKPLFALKDVQVQNISHCGKDGKVTRCILAKDGTWAPAICFNGTELPPVADLCFTVGVNAWNGQEKAQIIIENVRR